MSEPIFVRFCAKHGGRRDTQTWIVLSLLRGPTIFVLALALGFCITRPSWGYSVLTHEAIIDAEWDEQIKPLLLERFPNATVEQLR